MTNPQPPKPKEPLYDCSGCTDRNSEGTHQGHTKQHGCFGCLHNEPERYTEERAIQEAIWQNLLDTILIDDKEFNSFSEVQWRRLKKILHPITHESVRDFIPAQTTIELARADERNKIIAGLKKMAVEMGDWETEFGAGIQNCIEFIQSL